MNNPAKRMREARSTNLHNTMAINIRFVRSGRLSREQVLRLRRYFTKSLIDLKRNKASYDFGPVQLKALDVLIKKSSKAVKPEEFEWVHRNTCILGGEKH